MKRITALLTAVCLLLCLTACGEPAAQPEPETATTAATMQNTTSTEERTDASDTSDGWSGDSTAVSGESETLPEDSTAVSDPTAATGSTTIPDVSTTGSGDRVTGTAHNSTSTGPKPSKVTIQKVTTTKKPTTTRPTAAPLVDVKEKKLSVLIIGNSHSIDAFWLLYRAYKDQYPDTDLCVGILHYNGASINRHISYLESGESVMRYYKNSTGGWEVTYNVTSESVLTDQPWDVIMMQPGKLDLQEEGLNQEGRHKLAKLVDRYVKHPHKFVWHLSWPNPNDETFFSPDYIRVAPEGYKDRLIRVYGFNPVTQFTLMTDLSRTWAVKDPLYSGAVCSGASVMHALLTQGMAQLDLWRDYTHLSDYGRLMVGYAITAQLTGQPIKQVGIDVIPVSWRHKQNKPQGPQTLTKKMKRVIVEAANYSLKDPWHMPPERYPVPTITTTTTTQTKTVVSATEPTTTESTTEPTTTTTEESWIDSDCVLPTSTKETKPTKTTE